jgi:hypothetical protein
VTTSSVQQLGYSSGDGARLADPPSDDRFSAHFSRLRVNGVPFIGSKPLNKEPPNRRNRDARRRRPPRPAKTPHPDHRDMHLRPDPRLPALLRDNRRQEGRCVQRRDPRQPAVCRMRPMHSGYRRSHRSLDLTNGKMCVRGAPGEAAPSSTRRPNDSGSKSAAL